MMRVEEQGANQIIEAVLENVWPNGNMQLYAHGNDTDGVCHVAYFQFVPRRRHHDVQIDLFHHTASEILAGPRVDHPHAQTHPITVRFEADADGTLRAYVDDTLAATWIDPAPIIGPRVGVGIEYGGTPPVGGMITGSTPHPRSVRLVDR